MTKQELAAASAGKKLAKALLAVERYDGDPADVSTEARYWLRHGRHAYGTKGADEALTALAAHYSGGER